MKSSEITPVKDVALIAACGLYCGTCAKYKNGKCPGCKENSKASWCKIRSCNMEHGYGNCSQCQVANMNECKKLNNTIGKIFGLIFKTDRLASLQYIKDNSAELYVDRMVAVNQMAIKRGQNIEL